MCSIDTNQEGKPGDERLGFGMEYLVTGRSLLLFELVLDHAYMEARGYSPSPAVGGPAALAADEAITVLA